MIRNKTIKFDMDKQADRELWEFLRDLEHGTFSLATKEYWRRQMEGLKQQEAQINQDFLDGKYSVVMGHHEEGE